MFKSLAVKLAGFGVAGVVTGAMVAGGLAAQPAAASVIRSPCSAGPSIAPSGGSVVGACFAPNTRVWFTFVGMENGTPTTLDSDGSSGLYTATSGTISAPIIWAYPCQTEYVYGEYGPNDLATNGFWLNCPLTYNPSGR